MESCHTRQLLRRSLVQTSPAEVNENRDGGHGASGASGKEGAAAERTNHDTTAARANYGVESIVDSTQRF